MKDEGSRTKLDYSKKNVGLFNYIYASEFLVLYEKEKISYVTFSGKACKEGKKLKYF